MKRQRSFSIKNTIPLFISFTIPFSVLLSFWAFGSSNSASSQTQLLLSPGGLKDSKPEVSASSGTNLSVAEPKAMILMETHGPEAAVPPKASYSVEVGRNGDFTDTHLSNFTIWSSESMGLVGRSNGSIIGGAFSISSSNRTISSIVEEVGAEACDVSDGRWVYDESYPLYSSDSCPYIDEAFSCEANGRMDRDYMKWRWQPNHCNIPRYSILTSICTVWFRIIGSELSFELSYALSESSFSC
ncbi:hypothetical protein AXF42_Ash012112 [Apostasia shenzhenica]|uniref:Trichome birefringence-like N-terminal domain-containing protein n=1 Tax=Apostasia shenzhenica TaxID=1088818 RepID=A0A2I0AJV2_9ASPA|nr:hypothetical protein AXF42_Ash012112 [Apostasia shenzhenica]